jgi:zinc protease
MDSVGNIKLMRIRLLLLSLLAMLSISAMAQNNIKEFQLKNGLKVIIKEDHRSPVVLFSVWYKVGGSYEHDGLTGISHVVEHMMFRGTPKYPAGMLEKVISDNGGEQNAMTENDQTVYYERVSADKLAICAELEADRMQNLSLLANDFAKEIQVVMEERRMRYDDDPTAVTYERFMAAAFVNSPYHHQAIGWMTDLVNMNVEDVRQWYHAWYAPNNATVVIVGDVKPDQAMQIVQNYFGSIPTATIKKLKPRTEISALGAKQVDVSIPAKVPMIYMAYQVPVLTTVKTEDKWQPYALDVLATLLGGSDSSRLMHDLVRGQQIASAAQTNYEPLQLHSSVFLIVGIPAQKHSVAELENAIKNEIQRLQTTLVSQQELDRVKAQVIAQNVYDTDSLINQATELGTPESIGLSWQISQQYVANVSKITVQQIQQVAQKFLTPQRLTIGILHPVGEYKEKSTSTTPLAPLR